MSQPNWQWMVAAWKPHAQQPHAWKLHCVDYGSYVYEGLGGRYDRSKALCGMRPRYGWGGDLFIEDCCAKCSEISFKSGVAPPPNPDGKPGEWDLHYFKPELLRGKVS